MTYDTVCSIIQIKATPEPVGKNYEIGDPIPLPDGAYLGYEGAFVVQDSRVLWVTAHVYGGKGVLIEAAVFDKWGGPVSLRQILDPSNPVAQTVGEIREQHVLEKIRVGELIHPDHERALWEIRDYRVLLRRIASIDDRTNMVYVGELIGETKTLLAKPSQLDKFLPRKGEGNA